MGVKGLSFGRKDSGFDRMKTLCLLDTSWAPPPLELQSHVLGEGKVKGFIFPLEESDHHF